MLLHFVAMALPVCCRFFFYIVFVNVHVFPCLLFVLLVDFTFCLNFFSHLLIEIMKAMV